jgi:hypothetical protein
MKKAIINHGWGGSPEEPMLLWIKKELEDRDYSVVAPEMPNTEEPEIGPWVDTLKEALGNIDGQTIFIGHSIGCQTILRFLEKLEGNTKIGKVILIAPWIHLDEKTIEEEGEEVKEIAKPWVETPIDWAKVKSHCDNFVCIFSDNDPYVPLSEEKLFKEKLGAKTLVLHERSHFDPAGGVEDLPEILDFLK